MVAEPAFFSPAVKQARRFYQDLNPASRGLTVVSGGLEHSRPDYEIHRQTFPFFSIEYVARGAGNLRLRGRTCALEPGMIFSYGPGVAHDITGSPPSVLVKYFVDFSGSAAAGMLRQCKLPAGQVARVFPPNTLCALFDELIETGLEAGPGNAELCVKLLECLALKISVAITPLKTLETTAYATYQQCRQKIEQHFLKLETLEEVARECHADKAYLCRLFRRFDRRSPYQYLLRLKMNHAAARLQQPGVLVKQAAEEVGFSDPFHFSRVFRKALGVSPAKFKSFR